MQITDKLLLLRNCLCFVWFSQKMHVLYVCPWWTHWNNATSVYTCILKKQKSAMWYTYVFLSFFLHFWLDANCISLSLYCTLHNDNKVESNHSCSVLHTLISLYLPCPMHSCTNAHPHLHCFHICLRSFALFICPGMFNCSPHLCCHTIFFLHLLFYIAS